MSISSILISWYLQKKRNLPWRNTGNPYHIWISEIILQQTRVAQGLGYYERFIASFPDIKSLANAQPEEVLKVWQGLGYYSRARNLHAGAKYVLQQLNGVIPSNYEELLKIKGVGEYTAAAIGSFAFNIPLPVVDGNVNRVLARFFGIHDPINSTSGIKQIRIIAEKILDVENPGIHNQAIMEFGALQCTIRSPDCVSCPLQKNCFAFIHDEVSILPNKIRNQKIRNRYFNYLVITFGDAVYIKQRQRKDIWEGLYDFPLIETEKLTQKEELTQHKDWFLIFGKHTYEIAHISSEFKHQLSHQTIHATFYFIRINNKLNTSLKNEEIIKWKDFFQYPVSKLIDNYISTIDL